MSKELFNEATIDAEHNRRLYHRSFVFSDNSADNSYRETRVKAAVIYRRVWIRPRACSFEFELDGFLCRTWRRQEAYIIIDSVKGERKVKRGRSNFGSRPIGIGKINELEECTAK